MAIKTIIVLAGGASASKHDLKNLKSMGYVIGVNDACIHAPVDCGVSMDRTWFEHRWATIKALSMPFYVRQEAVVNVSERWDLLNIFECDRLSSYMVNEKGMLNGLNSGFCALNLAFQMRPDRVVPLGFDCENTGYWYPPYEWQTAPEPKGKTSNWAFQRWKEGFFYIQKQFEAAGIQWG
jgi:hypothetical protein